MKELLGWVQSSDMPSVYIHLSGRDVDGALLKAHGIMPNKEETVKMELTIKICPRCKQKIGPETQFCPFCGMASNDKSALRLEQEKAKADQMMDMLMNDEEVRKFLAEKVQQLYASSELHPPSEATP
jgi:hypothetical protein